MSRTLDVRAGGTGSVKIRIDELGGRRVVLFEIDPARNRGALSPDDGEGIAAAAALALAKRIPLVGFVASSGADILGGIAATFGWGTAARAIVRCSGTVPVLLVVTGPAVSGPALFLGLADVVIMIEDSYAFVSGPHMVQEFTGEILTSAMLGGPGMHARTSGVASLVVRDVDDARLALASVLAYLPSHTDVEPERIATDDPANRRTPELVGAVPASPTGSYDVRDVARAIVDDRELLELRAGWATNLVTCLASIAGRPVGIVANQPQALAGTLDITASQKGGRFVAMCDAFNLPLVTLIDTSGFYPGKDLEWRGMIRYGAQLAFAYARATVPRVNVTLRKSYGGAYIVMDSKYMGNDLAYAWPSAEIAVMGAKGAAEILHRRATPEERVQLEQDYEERLLNPYIAAERGSVDAVIDPTDTRRCLAEALGVLAAKRERLPRRRHDNSPL
ncbi:MAG TPA: carboxyl transferase domain-containing protein [Acidimicrobiales bacterium]|jgi:acetyl-CoA carboxylase carboxyltransferase component|nr:carboxyl transferase domain-containing protein [Acidimicrobiales bacterium]